MSTTEREEWEKKVSPAFFSSYTISVDLFATNLCRRSWKVVAGKKRRNITYWENLHVTYPLFACWVLYSVDILISWYCTIFVFCGNYVCIISESTFLQEMLAFLFPLIWFQLFPISKIWRHHFILFSPSRCSFHLFILLLVPFF